jgi:hypothetical protein
MDDISVPRKRHLGDRFDEAQVASHAQKWPCGYAPTGSTLLHTLTKKTLYAM